MALEAENLTAPEPAPVPNDRPAIADLVIDDLRERKAIGIRKYGTALQAFNGRRALVDLYQELLDATQYVRQELEQRREIKAKVIAFVRRRALDLDVEADMARVRGHAETANDLEERANELVALATDLDAGACDALE